MSTSIAASSVHDAQLVARSLLGDTVAFGGIVERYQGLICALAYSACGNAHLSEDLAQETFITAWRQLRNLREADKLKAWLCGIARNVVNNHLRKQQRTPTAGAAELHESMAAPADSPSERAMSRQEESLVWRTLEALPENYREPLILFYRHQESVAAVAAALDLSEDAVKQRLSRGRAMLTEQVGQLVGDSLRKSGPRKAFSLAVIAALPLLGTSSCATSLSLTAAKGAATAKAASWIVFLNAVLCPFLGIASTWFGYKVGIDSARSDEERRLVIKIYRAIAFVTLAGGVAFLALMRSSKDLLLWHPTLFAAAVIGFIVSYAGFIVGGVVWAEGLQRSMRRRALAAVCSPGKWALPYYERRSKIGLLGLPLYHVRIGSCTSGRAKPLTAWFAVGDFAIGGIFAFGAVAIAPISFGGAAAGILSLGGLSFGLLSWGGFAIGVWAVGGLAMGVQSLGAVAAGWRAAHGVLAVARDFAIGESAALARHANDSAAREMIARSPFFQRALTAERYAVWFNLLFAAPFALMFWKIKRAARGRGETGAR